MNSHQTTLIISKKDCYLVTLFASILIIFLFLMGILTGQQMGRAPGHSEASSINHKSTSYKLNTDSLDYDPQVFATGPMSVLVGVFDEQSKAEIQLDLLKQLGFKYAYLEGSSRLKDAPSLYHLYLGFFPDTETARTSAEILVAHKVISSYAVTQNSQSH